MHLSDSGDVWLEAYLQDVHEMCSLKSDNMHYLIILEYWVCVIEFVGLTGDPLRCLTHFDLNFDCIFVPCALIEKYVSIGTGNNDPDP